MSERKIEAAYDQWHQKMQQGGEMQSPLQFPWYRSVYSAVQNQLAGSVLEIGCGRGEFAIWLSQNVPGVRIVGVDFSSAAIQIARAAAVAAKANVEFVQGDAESLQFPDHSFDWAISCECIEHVPHPPKMAMEMARVLKPGARFALTTENYLNGMLIAWFRAWVTKQPFNSGSGIQPRENFFFYWMVRHYLRTAGLEVEDMQSCHYQWLLLPKCDPAKLCTTQFSQPWARRLALPFGRHFSFFGSKLESRSHS